VVLVLLLNVQLLLAAAAAGAAATAIPAACTAPAFLIRHKSGKFRLDQQD
jgi:hypothetical protein